MSRCILVVAPHPDDETLGCGGTLLRHIAEGDKVYWLIFTQMMPEDGYLADQIQRRQVEINRVAKAYSFSGVIELPFRAAQLDALPLGSLVQAVAKVVNQIQPDTVYIPYRNDAHSDHACVFDAVSACSKSFRYPFIKTVYAYETLSETGFSLTVDNQVFTPNTWVAIDTYLEQKIEIMRYYEGEMGVFPFPRSEQTMRALAQIRGSQCNTLAAEAFMLLKSIR
jgi:LmbE family N-acetylglucosaminyl deacetylase